MKIGRLGTARLTANTNTTVYTVPALNTTTGSILLCNTGTETTKIRLAIVDGLAADLDSEDYIEYGSEIPAGGVLERSGVLMSAGETVIAWADKNTVTVRVHGYEEA